MRTVQAEALSVEKFLPFGCYAKLIDPDSEKIGAAPIEFFRDMLQQDQGGAQPSFSTCRVKKRPLVIDVTEYHSATAEGTLPLDNNVLIHVGPATPRDAKLPLDKFRVFHVPAGTLVVTRPGVWHHAAFTTNAKPANVLIILPERTYANDCTVVELSRRDRLAIKV